jgi:adenine-specific DNA-methyltransferase
LSRLTELIAQAKAKDPTLGQELEQEFKVLSSRRSFGLNFERHRPESVELPGRPIRKGDKVRILPPRGTTTKGDQRLWKVPKLEGAGGKKTAQLELLDSPEPEQRKVAIADLIVVAEFKDFIYPGLVSTGKVERGSDKPFHTVINAENFHALEALTFTHRSRIDVIYIDPPYNSRAKDWKYNNDYVDPDDDYRHSKWLAMMERRLKLADELLCPHTGVLILTIDDKEVHRAGLLLEQIFQGSDIQMITSVISAKGALRIGKFSRVEENIFVVSKGKPQIAPWYRNMLDPVLGDGTDTSALEWLGLRRREPSSKRGARPNQFYPIFVHETNGHLHSVGAAVEDDIDRNIVEVPEGTVALWPLKPDGTEMLWGLTPDVLRRNWAKGYARVNSWNADEQRGTVQYLPGGTISQIESGTIQITGRKKDGSVVGTVAIDEEAPPPKRVWNLASHNAEIGGTNVLSKLIPGRSFPYPKSLYAVEDCLRFFIEKKEDAIVLDYFSGSGTTAHAVMRINRLYGGKRQSISITNNEVSAAEAAECREAGLRPGDADWEKLGICDHVTKPRIQAAITGITPNGKAVDGDYKFTDEFPMAEGFEENAEFFTLTYETPVAVSHNRAFKRIAPLLWMRAGSEGKRIEKLPAPGWEMADTYGLLIELDAAAAFAKAVKKKGGIRVAFIVTDDERRFQTIIRSLPETVEPVRLYESYLTNFRFSMGR